MTEFQTFWVVDGCRCTNFETVKKFVARGKVVIEVSAEQQEKAHTAHRRRERENAALDQKIRQAAAQRAYEQSPEGKADAARRNALKHPGGIVSGVVNELVELDAFSPDRTNVLK